MIPHFPTRLPSVVSPSNLEKPSHTVVVPADTPVKGGTRSEYMLDLETKINIEIGYRFWKKYVTAAFWSYISLPINLSITMMTALSTGQATTNNLLPKNLYINISLATLVISVLNTYFRPYVQMNQNIEYMNKWSVLGCVFEEIYYGENQTPEHIDKRIEKYESLMKSINDLKKAEILETQNFLTDSIHLALRSCYCCLKNKNSWLALDETLKAEDDDAKKRLADDDSDESSENAEFGFFKDFMYAGENTLEIPSNFPTSLHSVVSPANFEDAIFTNAEQLGRIPVSPEMERLYFDFPTQNTTPNDETV